MRRKKDQEMVDAAGAALGTAFGELFKLVKHVVKTIAAFRKELEKIKSTLEDIEPIINDINEYNKQLDRGPEEMAPIKDLLEKGRGLVVECCLMIDRQKENKWSKIHPLNLLKMYMHAKKLTNFNTAVVKKFQIYMQLVTAREVKKVSVGVKETGEDVKKIGGDVKEIRGDMKGIGEEVEEIQADVKETGGDVKEIREEVKEVGGEVKETREDVKEIQGGVREMGGNVKEIWGDVKEIGGEVKEIHGDLKDMGGDVKDIRGDVKEMKELFSTLSNVGDSQSGLEALGGLAIPAAPDFIVGSEVEASLIKLKEKLLEEGVSVTVVTAPGGCGKTTLVKKLCREVAIEGKFKDKIMFVPVSKKPSLTDIFQKMCQHNSFKVPEMKSEADAVRCLQQLLKKIGQDPVLLVLDDVWKESESIVDNFVCDEIKDYKIVVTSRYEFPQFRPVHHLNPLTRDEAVELFRQCVIVDDRSMGAPDTKLLNEIVDHCKRLPLVIKVVAKSLRGKEYAFWKKKLRELSERHSLHDLDTEILTCLKKSLDDLDGDPSIKERFMDLGSFPEDRKIPATALIDMWVELYKLDPNGMRAITDIAITDIHELEYRNLADLVFARKDSRGDDESYRCCYITQHDLLRELAIMECNQEEVEERKRLILDLTGNNIPNWWREQKQQPLRARLVSISTDGKFSTPWPNLELPAAEALVLNFQTDMQTKTYALPEFIAKSTNLKALIVTNYSFCPAELGNFHVIGSNLKRIRLERVAVPLLSMGNIRLHNLEKISFSMCDISQASTSNDAKISDAMPNLQELDIDYCNDLVALPDDICKIKPLRKLSITNCHNFSTLPEYIGQLASLEVIRLNSCTTLSQLPDSIRSLQNVTLLDISDCLNLSALPDQIGQMANLERINMRGCLRLSRLPKSIVKLRNLRKVVCEEEKTYVWGPFKDSLPGLEITLFKEEASLDWLDD